MTMMSDVKKVEGARDREWQEALRPVLDMGDDQFDHGPLRMAKALLMRGDSAFEEADRQVKWLETKLEHLEFEFQVEIDNQMQCGAYDEGQVTWLKQMRVSIRRALGKEPE